MDGIKGLAPFRYHGHDLHITVSAVHQTLVACHTLRIAPVVLPSMLHSLLEKGHMQHEPILSGARSYWIYSIF